MQDSPEIRFLDLLSCRGQNAPGFLQSASLHPQADASCGQADVWSPPGGIIPADFTRDAAGGEDLLGAFGFVTQGKTGRGNKLIRGGGRFHGVSIVRAIDSESH